MLHLLCSQPEGDRSTQSYVVHVELESASRHVHFHADDVAHSVPPEELQVDQLLSFCARVVEISVAAAEQQGGRLHEESSTHIC